MLVVTPRLVKPLTTAAILPTDNHVMPTRADVHLMGRAEGTAPVPARGATAEAAPLPPAPPTVAAPAPPAATPPADTSTLVRTFEPVGAERPTTATPTAVRPADIEARPVSPYVPVSSRP